MSENYKEKETAQEVIDTVQSIPNISAKNRFSEKFLNMAKLPERKSFLRHFFFFTQ